MHIIRLYDSKTNRFYYLEWNVDLKVPFTIGLSLRKFREEFIREHGEEAIPLLNSLLKRTKLYNISGYPPYDNLNVVLQGNKAGENETYANYETLLNRYCRKVKATTKK